MISDNDLLEIYMLGFNDELWDKPHQAFNDELQDRAYILGTMGAIAGDEVSSVDLKTNEETLKEIKGT
tara:strand:- start:11147 stop:11350 length:204 start_codon:yes stop_codon:yes gene_type:complete